LEVRTGCWLGGLQRIKVFESDYRRKVWSCGPGGPGKGVTGKRGAPEFGGRRLGGAFRL